MLKFHRSSTSTILLDSVTTLRALRQRALAHFTEGSLIFLLRRGSFSTMVRAETRSRKPDIKTQTNNSLALRFLLSTCFMLEAMFVDLFCSRIHSSRFPTTNNMSDKVLLNFGAKYECYLLISHVILQCCHGNFPTTPK